MNVFSNLKHKGSFSILEEFNELPSSPERGSMTLVKGVMYVYTALKGVLTWYPLTNEKVYFVQHQGEASTEWVVKHNLGTTDIVFFTYDENNYRIEANQVPVDNNSFKMEFTNAKKGKVVVFSAGGENACIDSYSKIESDNLLDLKADKGGDSTQVFQVANGVNANEAINVGQFNNLLPRTSAPVVTIANSVNENAGVNGSYTSGSGTATVISASKGTIKNHDPVAKTFEYVAYDITSGVDESATVNAYSTKAGEIRSLDNVNTLTIVFVPMVADGTLSNANYATNVKTSSGFIL